VGRTLVAVDLGGSGIRAAQFTVSKGRPVIKKTGYIALPEGVVELGEVKDAEALSTALRELWAEAKFTSKQVVFGLANEHVVVRILTLDWDVEEDFRKSLRYQPGVADALTFDIEQANIDYHPLSEFTVPGEVGEDGVVGEEKKYKAILLVATERSVVDAFVDAFHNAGLKPVAADLTPFALIRAGSPVAPSADVVSSSESVEVIIDMGVDVVTVILHQHGQPRFVRIVVGTAGRHLTKVLSEHFTWSTADAERTKIELGLTGGVSADGSQHPAQHVVSHVLSAFIDEVRLTIQYFLSQAPQVTEVSRIVLSGGGTHAKGFAERLASEIRVPVEYAKPSEAVDNSKATLPEGLAHESQMAVAYGLAQGMV
jgi:type IV pilus assembly protein PilM